MELNERITAIRDSLCAGKSTTFALRIGSNYHRISGMCSGSIKPGRKTLDKIIETFPELSPSWLLAGEGPMLKPTYAAEEVSLMRELISSQQHTIEEQNKLITNLTSLIAAMNNKE